jgi:hypothetical protein
VEGEQCSLSLTSHLSKKNSTLTKSVVYISHSSKKNREHSNKYHFSFLCDEERSHLYKCTETLLTSRVSLLHFHNSLRRTKSTPIISHSS